MCNKSSHKFIYQISESNIEGIVPHTVTFEISGDASLNNMLEEFQRYLNACGYVFNGNIDIVETEE